MVATAGTENGKRWHLAPCLVTLVEQCDEKWPHRHKESDGSIGDAAHQAEHSEHNPDEHGVVRAVDITEGFGDGGANCQAIADSLQERKPRRLLYAIWNGHIMDGHGGTEPWHWRPYHGTSPHTDHIHISVVDEPKRYNSEHPWILNVFKNNPREWHNDHA